MSNGERDRRGQQALRNERRRHAAGSPRRRAMPSAPPISESTRLSVSSWRMMRRRPAPSAERTASSRVRTVARASSRLATFAQQISSTKPTTPRNSIDVSREIAADDRIVHAPRASRRGPCWSAGTRARARPRPPPGRPRAASIDDARLHAADHLQHVGAARPRRQVDERPHRPQAGLAEQLESPSARRRRRSTAIPSSRISRPTIDGIAR